jgi:hypothetical protein
MSEIRRQGPQIKFSVAAPNDLYPEGGLRLHARVPAYYPIYAPDSGALGCWSNAHYAFCAISPIGEIYTLNSNQVRFVNGSYTFAGLAGSFQHYRFRKLTLDYSPAIGTNTVGTNNLSNTLNVSYMRDPCSDLVQSTPIEYMNATTVQFPPWEPIRITCIEQKSASVGDELFAMNAINDGSADIPNARQCIQGVVAVFGSGFGDATTDYIVGYVYWDCVLDLYGFRQSWSVVNPERQLATRAERQAYLKQKAQLERKSEDPHDDFVAVESELLSTQKTRSGILSSVTSSTVTPRPSMGLTGGGLSAGGRATLPAMAGSGPSAGKT